VIAGLVMVAAGLVALPRPNPARVRLPALAAARGRGTARPSSVTTGRWRESFVRMGQRASARPHRVSSGAGGAAVAALFLTGLRLPVSLAAGLVIAIGTEAAIGTARARRLRSDDAALAQALSVLEAELAAGAREDAALNAAAAVSGRHGRQLREAAASTGYGSETADVLARSPSLRPLSAAWRVRHACGAPLAEVVAQVAQDVDLRRKRQLAVNSALAGARSSGALLAALPLVGIGLGMVMGARPLPFLFASDGGSRVLLVGVGLDVAGWLWTAAMVRRAGR
jgi:tight adherence protein B